MSIEIIAIGLMAVLLYLIWGTFVAVAAIHLLVIQGNTATKDFDDSMPDNVDLVEIPTHIGPLPAWQSKSNYENWLLIAHGLSGNIQETQHLVNLAEELNMVALSFTYTNHAGAPITDGASTFGIVEADDVDAAITYAMQKGAKKIFFAGMSHGGAIGLSASYRAAEPIIKAMVLQGPAINLRAIIKNQLRVRVPIFGGTIASLAVWWIWMREHIDLRATNYVKRSNELQVPTLILHGDSDDLVPIKLSRKFARLRPDLVQLVEFSGAEHIKEHLHSPDKFQQITKEFLRDQ